MKRVILAVSLLIGMVGAAHAAGPPAAVGPWPATGNNSWQCNNSNASCLEIINASGTGNAMALSLSSPNGRSLYVESNNGLGALFNTLAGSDSNSISARFYNAGAGRGAFFSTNSGSGATFQSSSGNGADFISQSGAGLNASSSTGVAGIFTSQGNEGIMVTSNGNVGASISSNTNDAIACTTGAANRSCLYATNYTGSGWGVFAFTMGTGRSIYGANPDTSNGWAGYFDGRTFTSLGNWSSSAREMKQKIEDDADGAKRVLQLHPVTFEWRPDAWRATDPRAVQSIPGSMPQGRFRGLIADEVQQQFPELVATDADGRLAVNYPGLTSSLVALAQAHDTEIQALKAENVELRSRLSAVEQAIGKPAVSESGDGGGCSIGGSSASSVQFWTLVMLLGLGAVLFSIRRRRPQ